MVGVSDPVRDRRRLDDATIGRAEVRYDRSRSISVTTATELAADAARRVPDAGLQVEIGGPLAAWEQCDGSTELLGVLAAMVVLTLVFGSMLAMLLPIGLALIVVRHRIRSW